MRELLEESFLQTCRCAGEVSRLGYLADHIFQFTTYDDDVGELFAGKALEVCAAISSQTISDFIEDPESYRWYLLMVNMPFFAGRLDWGVSIRGAWWARETQTLESCGIWRGGEQVLSMEFSGDEWQIFISALVTFAKDGSALP